LLGNSNARRAASRRSVSRVPEYPRHADEPPSAPHGARRSHDALTPAAGTPLALYAQAGRGAAPLRKETAMGTSLLWQTDTQLHDSVQRQLEWDPEIDAHDVAVTASDGVITLTGFVHSYATKLAAEQSVKRVRGVRAVANDIQVVLRSERTDPEIAKDAVHALRVHTNVPNQITVIVRHGFLTLEGAVEWMFQKVAAGSAVAYLDGVKSVSNLIQVKPSASAGQIKTSSVRS
jgi:osmotically-inducible protein OsmY